VLVNLAVNGRDAMAGGGKLTIETAKVAIEKEYLQQHVGVEPGRYVLLTVSDTGCGMDAATQTHIFEPFFTTKDPDKGTGLGLSTVYGIVRQSGGFITVYSEPGHGSTFKIYLPRASEQTAPAPGLSPADTHSGPRHHTETILLVEDDQTVRQLIAHYLNSVGCQTLVAAAPAEALEVSRDFAGPIHLMITDVIMPQMSGRELAHRLRPQRPGMKVLFISGYTANAIIDQGNMEAGSAFLQMPFTVATLSRQLKKILDQ
jgi:CheY-like chemotaxis protein